jgi:hypothetical protein
MTGIIVLSDVPEEIHKKTADPVAFTLCEGQGLRGSGGSPAKKTLFPAGGGRDSLENRVAKSDRVVRGVFVGFPFSNRRNRTFWTGSVNFKIWAFSYLFW